MALETGSFIDDLVSANPPGTDGKNQGDDHLRLLKTVLRATFPGLAGAVWRTQDKGAGYTALTTDNMSLIRSTAAFTLTMTAAATLGNQWVLVVYADVGNITITPDGTEEINHLGAGASLTLVENNFAMVFCDGSQLHAFIAPTITPATLTGPETLTNKTLTSPTLNTPTLADPVVTGEIDIPGLVAHVGDLTTRFGFSAVGTFRVNIVGAEKLDVTASGLQLNNTGARVQTVLDEDDMTSNSATDLSTQQSIKSYVDGFWTFGAIDSAALGGITRTTGDIIRTGAKQVVIIFDSVGVDGTNSLRIQLGTTGGTEATGYVSTVIALPASTAANNTTGFALNLGTGLLNGIVYLERFGTEDIWHASGIVRYGSSLVNVLVGEKTLTGGDLSRVVITTSGDLFDAGQWRIKYGGY